MPESLAEARKEIYRLKKRVNELEGFLISKELEIEELRLSRPIYKHISTQTFE